MDFQNGLREAFKKLSLKPILDEQALKEFLKEIQVSLIKSDVPVKLVFELTKTIEQESKKQIPAGLSLKEHVLKVAYDQLCSLVGGEKYIPELKRKKILLLGLYGSGKTTSAAKLAYFYKSRGLSVAVVCADVDRPAAYEQLEQLSKKVGAKFYGKENEKNIQNILKDINKIQEEVIIVDSAGRSAFDEEMIKQIKLIDEILKPDEKILVLSADIGQIAGKQAKEFDDAIKLTSVFITKMDGSGKGGGALAACHQTGVNVSFIGNGEKVEDIEVFDSKKFIGRLLGFPDFETLIEKIKNAKIEEEIKAEDLERFDFEIFYKQLKAAKKLGPLSSVLSMMGLSDLPKDMLDISEKKLKKYETIINSMTKKEKRDPKLLKEQSRIERISKGSGIKIEEVRELINQFNKMEKMFLSIKKNKGLRKRLEKMFGKDLKDFEGLVS
jgi:signal recognition particle subunit SRP54